MANGLSTVQPIVHQALHGYAEGHRQLALSTTLKSRDQRTLLALSDISGPRARLDEEGYLTGFPLSESGLYALARTWPAPEMPRPGCVWTHTLLVDFTDLGGIDTLSDLLHLFRRPTSISDALDYAVPTRLRPETSVGLPSVAERWTRQVMAALYGKAKSRIVALRSDARVDESVIALWSQQWPRLRRVFRFCTFAISDRSSDGAEFDLQVLPGFDRSLRSRFADAVDAEAVSSTDEWLDDAFEDLLLPDHDGMRSFLRRLGAESSGGREAFGPLCRLHHALTKSQIQSESFHNAVSILENEFQASEAQAARVVVARAALEQSENLDARSFDFLLHNLGILDADSIAKSAVRLGLSAWRRDPQTLIPLLSQDGLKLVVEKTLDEVSVTDLVDGLSQAPGLLNAALSRRPEIVGEPALWSTPSTANAAFEAARKANLQSSAIAGILRAGQSDLASRVVQELGAKLVLEVLGSADQDEGNTFSALVRAATKDTNLVAEFLASQASISRSLLYAVALVLSPDSVPNDYGTDPWLIAWQRAVGSIGDAAFVYMAAFLLARALGRRSRSQAELAQIGFEVTYVAVASNHLSIHSWSLLDSQLPWSDYAFGWDRCWRLRAGVVELFVDRDLSPSFFAALTKDTSLFALLASEAGKRWRGGKYLKRVRDSIQGQTSFSNQVYVIERVLND
jgi:hypothetical protein